MIGDVSCPLCVTAGTFVCLFVVGESHSRLIVLCFIVCGAVALFDFD